MNAIESMRNNKRGYFALTEEEKKVCKEAYTAGKLQCLNDDGEWFLMEMRYGMDANDIYRISPDWPEPEVVEYKVERKEK